MPVSGAQHAWVHEMLQAAVHSMYIRDGSGAGVDRPHRRRLVLLERQLQRAVAAELRAAGVQVRAQRRDGRPAPDLVDRRRARVAEHALAVRIGAAADHPAVAEHDERVPRPAALKTGGEEVQGHRGLVILSRYAPARDSRHAGLAAVCRHHLHRSHRDLASCRSHAHRPDRSRRRPACASSCRRRRRPRSRPADLRSTT